MSKSKAFCRFKSCFLVRTGFSEFEILSRITVDEILFKFESRNTRVWGEIIGMLNSFSYDRANEFVSSSRSLFCSYAVFRLLKVKLKNLKNLKNFHKNCFMLKIIITCHVFGHFCNFSYSSVAKQLKKQFWNFRKSIITKDL